jgi:DNA-binding transcriptional MerR regulator
MRPVPSRAPWRVGGSVVLAASPKTFSVGEAARHAGLTPKAVRLYEERGLLPPVERTESGYRTYTRHHIQLLRFIRQARGIGLGLAEIHKIIELRRDGIPPADEVVALLQDHLGAIDHAISDLRTLRGSFAEVLQIATSDAAYSQHVQLCKILDDDQPAC